MDFTEFDFKDFKQGEISCDSCQTRMGTTTGNPMEGHLCVNCTDELEQHYKKLHPEEYN